MQAVLCRLMLQHTIHAWGANINVKRQDVPNELDAAFAAHNRLFTLECKTAAMVDKDTNTANVANILYKVDSLRERFGGVFASTMLCSVLPLPSPDRQRAATLGVQVVSGKDLFRLEELCKQWIKRV